MTRDSSLAVLVLHAVRILGFADTPRVAERFGLDAAETEEQLLDAQALGWVSHAVFAELRGWSLTDRGRVENERQLAAELADAGGTAQVSAVYREFLPLNARLLRACTDWQLRPTAADQLAPNDHADPEWDAAVHDELVRIELALAPLVERLGAVLTRFRDYDTRFSAARRRAAAGDHGWIDRSDIDSCHRVWFQLHEDLIATLGLDRGSH